MGLTVTEKVLSTHVGDGKLEKGGVIGLKIDQCLTQDSTGTMAWLQFESLGIPRVKCEVAVSYVDHTSLSFKGESSDDHLFLMTSAKKFGAFYSKPGNGVCHQVHYERFAAPGKTLLGSDSHTPTSSSLGMIAIGAGGADVAVAMGGGYFYMKVPKIMKIHLEGKLQKGVSAKDVILEVLRRISVKGGVGYILEYTGPGVETLSIPERATITNMGAETGATTSIFPSDEVTREFLRMQGRERDWVELKADVDCVYDVEHTIDLNSLEPMVAMPGSPDNIKPISEVEGFEIQQVYIGSCTNGSYRDLAIGALMLEGRRVNKEIEVVLSPGSRQVEQLLLDDNSYSTYVRSGVRIVEPGCHACIGMGYVPGYGHHSVRTVNRNWFGRGGSNDARLILTSVETAIASAIAGKLADPRKLDFDDFDDYYYEDGYIVDDSMLISPVAQADAARVEIVRAPNIKPIRAQVGPEKVLKGEVLLKVGDGISTDDILPAGSLTQHLRSNLPEISKFTYYYIDKGFASRAIEKGGGFIVGGENYGQGSSREHAALAPWQLNVKAVIAKSYARIHKANLINAGVIPFVTVDEIDMGDQVEINLDTLASGKVTAKNLTKNKDMSLTVELGDRDYDIIMCGGLLAYTRSKHS
ncbi:aconitate hydratase [Myxococcota bacterium]|nr:aconitate hydratase [Myxococcota bacterium]MBU1381890.1 aconitate hydratase [Myxococcota bacterium]MBU1497791.1 aconitate hydratase [Myxococcota bacterium]